MMYNAGVVTGFTDGSYKPNEPTLREQVIGMINTLIARPENTAPISKYGDITTSHWTFLVNKNVECSFKIVLSKKSMKWLQYSLK